MLRLLKIIKNSAGWKPLFFALLVSSCNSSQHEQSPKESSLGDQLVGKWKLSFIKLRMNTFNNSDSTGTREVNEANWESEMHMKPIVTFFKADGTYNSEHRKLNDSIFYNPAGKWSTTGDSLFMTDTLPQNGVSYKFKVFVKDNTAEFWSVEDFDHDGYKDDNYYGVQKRL